MYSEHHKPDLSVRKHRRFAIVLLLGVAVATGFAAAAAAQPSLGSANYDAYWSGDVKKLFTMPWETRVGIGTDAPQAALHVNSQTDAKLGAHDTGGVMIGRTSHAHQNLVLDGNEIMARNGTGAGPLYLNNDGGAVYVHAGGPAEHRLLIEADGRVRIGAGNRQHSQAKLTVDGDVVAEQVIVTIDGFPDYVFADDYELAPLSEIEAFIDLHHHLPHMPSAEEIAESGADLGELNERLLRTVEELTLHAIAQSKELERQRDSLARFEDELGQLSHCRRHAPSDTKE